MSETDKVPTTRRSSSSTGTQDSEASVKLSKAASSRLEAETTGVPASTRSRTVLRSAPEELSDERATIPVKRLASSTTGAPFTLVRSNAAFALVVVMSELMIRCGVDHGAGRGNGAEKGEAGEDPLGRCVRSALQLTPIDGVVVTSDDQP